MKPVPIITNIVQFQRVARCARYNIIW